MATVQRGQGSEALAEALAHVVQRLRLGRWVRHTSRGLLIGAALSLIAVALAHFGLLPPWLPLEAIVPLALLAGAGIGTLTALTRPIDPMTAARLAETRLGLKERLSSALEFERAQAPDDPEAVLLRRLQQQDAAAHARAVAPREAVPLRWPWEAKALIPALLLLLLTLVLPALPVFVPPALRAERAVVRKSGQKLVETARRIEKQADAQHLDSTKRLARAMQDLGRKMAQGKMDKKQAMTQMAALSKQMQDAQRRQAQTGGTPQAEKSLSQAGQQLSQALQAGQKAAQAAGQKAGQKAGAAGTTPEARRAAQALRQEDASGVSAAMRQLAQRLGGGTPPSAAQQQAAARDLQKLAQALQKTSAAEAQRQVQSAADALKRGDRQGAAEALRRAAESVQRQAEAQGQRQQDQQGVQQEQQSLQNSQGEMAQASRPSDIRPSQAGQSQTGQSQAAQSQSGQGGRQPQGGQQPQAGRTNPGQGRQGGKGGQPGGKGKGAGQRPGDAAGRNGNGGQQGGSPANGAHGNAGAGGPTTPGPGHYTPDSGTGYQTPAHPTGVVRGAPHPLDARFNPAKNARYDKVFLGKPSGKGGGGNPNPSSKSLPGEAVPPGAHPVSSVPYSNYAPPARAAAEKAMDTEDIPPAYRQTVGRYFNAIQPPAKAGAAHQ